METKIIDLGNKDQLWEYVKLGYFLYKKAKEEGMLQELGKDLLDAATEIVRRDTALEVEAFKAYTEAGMSSSDAVDLIKLRVFRFVDR